MRRYVFPIKRYVLRYDAPKKHQYAADRAKNPMQDFYISFSLVGTPFVLYKIIIKCLVHLTEIL